MESSWSSKNLELDLELDECMYRGNRDLLAHVWRNLIENAIKFSPEGSVIGIRLTQEDGMIRVTVSDQGPGISPEDRDRIFEKFYQGDRSRSMSGNGLGLSLVKRIAGLHNGTIRVESEPGKGAVFTVRLPA